jgi:aspartate aminotransferase-like enzyme
MAIDRKKKGMIHKPRLFTPGPTVLHPDVQLSLARPIVHHRTEEFRSLLQECIRGLRAFLKTNRDVVVLASSGTGAMEAALVNVLSPGEAMLALVAGKFGERWARIGEAHGMDVRTITAACGEAVAASDVACALDADPKIRAVFVQHSESSTGVRHDVEAIARVIRTRPNVMLVVDAISGAGALPLETSLWGLDIVVVGSQKSLALPPGLSIIAVGERARERIEKTNAPRYYLDLRREIRSQASGDTGFTPAITHIVALRAALDAIARQGGVDALVRNAATLAAMTRAAAAALGMSLVAPRDHGDALTALYPPEGVDAGEIVRKLKAEFAATVAGGQGELKGRIFRIAHLGYYDATDLLGLIATLEIATRQLGGRVTLGRSVAAAQSEYLRLLEAS